MNEDEVFPRDAEGLAARLRKECTEQNEWWRGSTDRAMVDMFKMLLSAGVAPSVAYEVVSGVAGAIREEFGN